MMDVDVLRIAEAGRKIRDNIERVIIGKGDVVQLLLVCIFSEGHVLVEDVPGVGKTMLARSVARSLDCVFRRIQCTPDLLPSDITGTHIYNQKTGEFEFRQGPVFAQVVLADEINRATPRSQSALLEAMEERQVTLEGETAALPRPFLVLATQNPVELEGTFPLPEAQLDRFLMRVNVGYTTAAEDEAILGRFAASNPVEELMPVVTAEQVIQLQHASRQVHVDPDVRQYVISLVRATREHPQVELGASTRAMIGVYRTAQAFAAISGRAFVIPDDVKYVAPFVLAHRIITKTSAALKGCRGHDVVSEILQSLPVPVEAGPGTGNGSGV